MRCVLGEYVVFNLCWFLSRWILGFIHWNPFSLQNVEKERMKTKRGVDSSKRIPDVFWMGLPRM